jgi:hypothetical protein
MLVLCSNWWRGGVKTPGIVVNQPRESRVRSIDYNVSAEDGAVFSG